MKRSLFFRAFFISLIPLSLCSDDLIYFLKSDRVSLKLSNQAKKDVDINFLDIDRYSKESINIGAEQFNIIDLVEIDNSLKFDLALTKSLNLSTNYNYNINELRIKERKSDIALEREYKRMLISLKYQSIKVIDMLNEDNFLDENIYSIIFNNRPIDNSLNKRLKVKIDWIKSKARYKFDRATFLRAKYRGGKLSLELNIRFAKD